MTDFWHQKVGMSNDEIGVLVEGAEVHCKTIYGCEVLHVMGQPYKDAGGYWQARIANRKIGSFLVTRQRGQFHTPGASNAPPIDWSSPSTGSPGTEDGRRNGRNGSQTV